MERYKLWLFFPNRILQNAVVSHLYWLLDPLVCPRPRSLPEPGKRERATGRDFVTDRPIQVLCNSLLHLKRCFESTYILKTSVSHMSPWIFSKILLNFREREREGERERNISVSLRLERPLLGTWPATQACTMTGNWTGYSLAHRPALNALSHTSRGVIWVI